MMRRKLGLCILFVTGLILVGTDTRSPIPEGVQQQEWFPASPKVSAERTWQEGQVNSLTQFIFYFWRIEGRAPKSLAELEDKGYFVVPRASFVSPVTGAPVRIVEDEPANPEAWDIAVVFGGEPEDLRILSFYPTQTNSGVEVRRAELKIGRSLRLPSLPEDAPRDVRERFQQSMATYWEEFNGEKTALLRGLPREDRTMFLICEYVSAATREYYAGNAKPTQSGLWEVPDRFAKLTSNFRLGVWNLRNPYTGQPLKNVHWGRPELGAITYGPEFLHKAADSPLRAQSVVCYGRQGKPITPKHERRLQALLSSAAP
jgi:hypothetical protein